MVVSVSTSHGLRLCLRLPCMSKLWVVMTTWCFSSAATSASCSLCSIFSSRLCLASSFISQRLHVSPASIYRMIIWTSPKHPSSSIFHPPPVSPQLCGRCAQAVLSILVFYCQCIVASNPVKMLWEYCRNLPFSIFHSLTPTPSHRWKRSQLLGNS